jgi:hypothetical protein
MLKKCNKCQKNYHYICFTNNLIEEKKIGKKTKIICKDCENEIKKVMKETKIPDYFKNVKWNSTNSNYNENDNNSTTSTNSDSLKQPIKKKSKSVPKFKLPKLKPKQKTILQKSLFRALKVKNIEFDDNLCFLDPDCRIEMNDSCLEPGIQKLDEENKKIYYQFKEKTNKGEYPPLEIEDDEIQVNMFFMY